MAGKLKAKALVSYDSSHDDDGDIGNDLLGLSLEKLNPCPRKKLLVIDLGGVLVHRVFRYDPKFNAQRHRSPDGIAGKFLVFSRPFCNDFLEFCFERFQVGIWSSARGRNIDGILSTLMRGFKEKLLFVWDQEECTESGFNSLEKKDKPMFLKELKKLWECPTLGGQYSKSNTLLIDNEPYKAILNPPHTAIFPNAYEVDNGNNDTVLGPKSELQIFLDGLHDAEDVPSYVKANPIAQPAITESHADWAFYSEIVRRFK